MKKSVRNFVENIDKRSFTNNVQKVLYQLLTADTNGGWMRLDRTNIPSSEARARDLRKLQYGEFNVFCRRAADLPNFARATDLPYFGGSSKIHYYRIGHKNLTISKLKTVFGD